MTRARIHFAALIACAAMAACGEEPPPSWHDEPGYRWKELVVSRGKVGFARVDAGRSGIRFENTVSESLLVGNRMLGQGAGVALGDVDGDGLVDVFLARTEGPNALYRNRGGWRFEDITAQAGVAAADRYSSGAALADIDGDRDLDLLLLATRGPNAVFVNDGKGRFSERRGEIGIDTTGKGGATLTMADVDGDGDLDLYVANYKAYHVDDTIPPQQRAFNQVVRQVGPQSYDVVPERRRDFKVVMRPDMGGLNLSMRGEPDDFYINEGGRFNRVSLTSDRFLDAQGKRLSEEPESFTLDAKFADLNADGAPDLYVANDFEDIDELWFNDGHGRFRLADWTAQRQLSNSAMGLDVADVSGDGLPDLFVVDMLGHDARLKTQIPTHTALPKRAGDVETRLQQQRNTLYLNRGDGTFGEISLYANVQASGWSWSTMFMDVDLDGWQDILIANGHLWDIMDGDTHERLQNRLTDVRWQRLRWEFPRLELKNVAFRNRGDLTFENTSESWRFGLEDDVSNTMAAGDLDNDGDQDVVVSRLGAPVLLLRNDAPAPRVAVRLLGQAPNTHAVGAKIRLIGGAVPTQEREVAVGGLFMSHSDYLASFAMGERDSATIVVTWRDGSVTRIAGVRPNRLYEIREEGGGRREEIRSPPTSSLLPPPSALFEDVSAQLAGHTHSDPPFDDWERQFLLPNSLSQLGPGVAWFDYDRDGDEDLAVGAGRSGQLAIFRNDRGRLTRQSGGLVAAADLTAIVGWAENGSSRFAIGVTSWEGQQVPAVVSVAANARGVAPSADPLVPRLPSATGPIALGDYDGDGDLDLFVGGRTIPAQYPRAASSALFRNDSGRMTPDSANARLLDGVGLVTAALFADIDSDGDADLILAREWGYILLLRNHGGRFTVAPDSWGLARWVSRWNGIATGDLNGDGRLDLVATSWGRNTATPADTARPLVLLHGAFGSAGEEEMLLARYDSRVRGLAPLNSYPRLRVTIPDLSQRVGTFAAYSDATADKVLGPSMNRVARVEVTTLDHMVFLNRGDRFEAIPLPAEAQFAPAFYAGVADFNGDGAEDVFLSQNFFPTAVGIPRYDAGRGLLLTGDGRGGLTPMPAAQSGVLVYGDQRGAGYADFDGDGRLDMAVAQNGAQTRLLRNRAGKPGLRVRVQGSAANPEAVGAQVRIVYGDRMGPVREIHAGSGYWSQNGAVQVFGVTEGVTAVWVRWPGGGESRIPVQAGAREITARR